MSVNEARERLVTARIRWNRARAVWLDDDGSDVAGESASRWEWAQARRDLEAAESELVEALAARADEP